MKLNEGNCHLLTFGTVQGNIKIKIGEAVVEGSCEGKLLRVIIDKKRNFKSHFSSLCKRVSQKLHALARVSTFMNSAINAQFSYCPLIWMLHERNLNARVHERALRIVYKDTHSDYEALLKLDNAVSVHQRYLQYLMTEMYKTRNSLYTSFMRELSKPRDLQYNFGNKNTFEIPKVRTTLYGIQTMQFIGLPIEILESTSQC